MNISQQTNRTSLRPVSSTEIGRSSIVSTSPRPQSTISSLPKTAEEKSTGHISEQGSTGQTTDKGSTGRFTAKKKQKRGKRGRSDGFVLGLDLANEGDSDTENKEDYLKKPGLDSESLNFIFWLRNPSVQNLSQLKKAIKCNDQDWMRCFLEFDGLGLLFQCLKNLSSYQSTHLNDMVLRMVCVSCIREVVNSRSGLDCLLSIGNRNDNLFGRRFSIAMETNNIMVKMQIFELLSALCLYSIEGFYLTLDALERYKVWRKQKYRFGLLVTDLRDSDLTNYKTTVMALINSIIVASENIRDRVRIRNEFVALNILDVINCLRDEKDGDLQLQLDVFEEELSADTEAMVDSNNKESIDINNHLDLFKAIYNKVNDTTLGLSLLSILYNLYQIDANSPLCESTWILIEKLTQQAVEGAVKADKLLEDAKTQRRCVDVSIQTMECSTSLPGPSSRLQRKSAILSGSRPEPPEVSAPPSIPPPPCAPPPPPPPPPPLAAPHHLHCGLPSPPGPPPPPPLLGGSVCPPPPPPPLIVGGSVCPPPPPPAPGIKLPGATPHLSPITIVNIIKTPDPSCKMKHFTWNKVPALQINKNSIWGDVNNMKDAISVEYNKLEELFGAKVVKEEPKFDEKVTRAHASPNEISLLDPKRSMNVNIFLKQFRKNNSAIVDLIRKGEARNIGIEKLKGLIKILPQMDEIEMIQNFEGDSEKLGNAEKFFLQLISVPCYKLRLELMLLKSDFQSQLSSVRSNLLLLSGLCRRLYNNTALKKFLRLVLHAGNFINKGSNAGDAVGFRISSLNKLALTKSNDPKMTLLHVLVEEAETKDRDALEFVDGLLDDLQKASRFSLDNVKSEFNHIKSNVKRLLNQMNTNGDEEIKDQFKDFLEEADGDMSDIDESLDLLIKLSQKLAQHFCENENSFNLEEFLGAFKEFCERVKACQQELESWKQQAEKAEMRKKAHEELLEKRKSAHREQLAVPPGARLLPGLAGTGDAKIVDNLVSEIRRGNVLRRLSVKRKSKPVPDVITESVRL